MAKQDITVYKNVTLFKDYNMTPLNVWGNFEVEVNHSENKARVKNDFLFSCLANKSDYSRWNTLSYLGGSGSYVTDKKYYGLTVEGNKVYFTITTKKSNIVELLELVKTTLENSTFAEYNTGICQVVDSLYSQDKITLADRKEIEMFLNYNKPRSINNTFKSFTENQYWVIGNGVIQGYWWDEMHKAPETKQIRLDYLAKLISIIK